MTARPVNRPGRPAGSLCPRRHNLSAVAGSSERATRVVALLTWPNCPRIRRRLPMSSRLGPRAYRHWTNRSLVTTTSPHSAERSRLLVGPTFGGTPALWSALLRAMATMPGVALLGTETAQSGATGVALAGATGEGYRTTIILSPSTGGLLEARNLLVGQLLAGLPFGVVTIQWIDRLGPHKWWTPACFRPSLAGQVPTGIVSAVTNPGVTLDRWNAWLHSVLPNLSAGAAVTSTPGVYGVSVVTLTPDPDIALIRRLFQESGLVHGIRSAKG